MNRILFTIFGIGLLALNGLRAQNEAFWEEVPGPYGGAIFDLVATVDGKLYAMPNYGAVYRSDDNGQTWNTLVNLDFTDSTDAFFYKIGKKGTAFSNRSEIWYSSDNEGASWSAFNPVPIASPPYEKQIYNFVEHPSGILSGFVDGQLVYSEDKGQTWVNADAPANTVNYFPYFKLLQDNSIVAAKEWIFQSNITYDLLRSIDSGKSWTAIQVSLPIQTNSDNLAFSSTGAIFLFNSYSTPIYRSAGSNQPFLPVPCDTLYPGLFGPNFPNFKDLITLPNGRLLKTEAYHIIYSDDDGLSWHKLDGAPEGEDNSRSEFFPNGLLPNGKIFMCRGVSGLYSSIDDGVTWNFSAQNINRGYVLEMHFKTDSSFYAVTTNGLWSTQDKGLHWEHLYEPLLQNNQGLYGGTPSRFLFFDDSSSILMGAFDKVLFSQNNGETLENIKPTNLDGISADFWYPYIDPPTKNLYISNYRSINNGATWETSNHPSYFVRMPSGTFIGLSDSSGSVVVIKSEDGGATWITQNTIPSISRASVIKCGPDGTLYAIGGPNILQTNFLLKSEDAGQTWTQNQIPSLTNPSTWQPFHKLEVTNLGHLILTTAYKTYLSVNKGRSWQSIPDPPDKYYIGLGKNVNFSISPSQYLYLSNSIAGLYKTRKPVSTGAYLHGHVLLDADADCSTEDATNPLKNWIVEASENGNITYTNTDSSGAYVMLLDTGSYQVGVKISNGIWWGMCDSIQSFQADDLFGSDTLNFSALSNSDCPLISVDVAVPMLRRCFSNTIYVQYCNIGSEPADSAWLDITLDPYLSLLSCPLPYQALGNHIFRVEIGNLAPADCGQFSFEAYINCDSTIIGQTHCISVHGFPDTLCTELPDWSGANVEAQALCQDSTIELKLKNTGTAPSQTLEYVIIEDDVVLLTGQESYDPAEEKLLSFPANGHTWRIESEQEPGHPFSVRALAFAEGCGGFESLGFINQFSVNGFRPSIDRECLENIGSYDPNDKQGFPIGIGDEHEIRPGQELEYKIRFQNTGTDTAFTVIIRDTLSMLLDPASVRPGASSHPYLWELSGDGVMTFRFDAIALPDSNVNPMGSQGFITFRVKQQDALPLGSIILNQAGIYFDFNEPVITNQTWHTVNLPTLSSYSPDLQQQFSDIQLSPNPASNMLWLESKIAPIQRVEISSATGLIQEILTFENPTRLVQINLSKRAPGTYFARIFCGNGVAVKKFVIGG